MSDPQKAKLKNRRRFTAEFKVQVVLELLSGELSLSEASARYQIKDTLLSRWKQDFLARAGELFAEPKESVFSEVAELKKIIAEQTIELAILKKAYGISTTKRAGSL
jgi:transposase-like protein